MEVADQPRPACLVVGVIAASLMSLLLMSIGFAFLYLRSPLGVDAFKMTRECFYDKEICGHTDEVLLKVAERESGVSINTLMLLVFGLGTLMVVSLVGLWQMKRWGWWLVMLCAEFGTLLGLMALASGSLLALALLLLIAGSLFWFINNKGRFV